MDDRFNARADDTADRVDAEHVERVVIFQFLLYRGDIYLQKP